MYTDRSRARFWGQLWQRDVRAFAHLLTPDLIVEAARVAGSAPGAGPLGLVNMVWLALACALHVRRSFADVLGLTFKLLLDLGRRPACPPPPPPAARRGRGRGGRGRPRRHDPRRAADTTPSEEAFCQARGRVPWAFWRALSALLTDRFERQALDRLRWRGRYRLLGLDGSSLDLPNERALFKAFGSAGRGKGRRQAQARLVVLQLTLARMPWRWDLVPLATSEQAVAAQLLAHLQPDDMSLMDRGFWSYALFWQVQRRQAYFAIRQRKQVKFKELRHLGPGDRLVTWTPASAAAKKAIKEQGLPASMTLRVIDYQIQGFRPSAVVTNLLDADAVPGEAFVRLAVQEQGRRVLLEEVGLYHRRWEIETTFFELKVTQGLEGGLRSRSEAGVRYEVAGHLLLYQCMRWLLAEAAQRGGEADPLRLSYQEALEEWTDLRPALVQAGTRRVPLLLGRLLERCGRHVVPYRPGRHYKRPNDTKAKAKGKGRYQPASKVEPAGGPPGQPPPTTERQSPRVA